jgi:hypothetical protein
VRLTGALSNKNVASALDDLVAKKRTIDLDLAADLRQSSLRLPQGAIQAAVLAVLRAASEPLQPSEIHDLVQQRLDCAVCRDTVSSFLSVAWRARDSPVIRVERGRYWIAP